MNSRISAWFAPARRCQQVDFFLAQKAQAQATIGCQPRPVAMGAKWLVTEEIKPTPQRPGQMVQTGFPIQVPLLTNSIGPRFPRCAKAFLRQ
jgi:hypothetical protein